MVYRIGAPPSGSKTPSGYLSEADEAITDDKARFAHTGQGAHGTKRRFYGLANEDKKNMVTEAREFVDGYIRDTNAASGH
jgi:hypothetical protein